MHDLTAGGNTGEIILHAALELSKNSWLLAIEAGSDKRPSLHHIKGGDSQALLAKLSKARERVEAWQGKATRVVICYEAGYDGFWLARLLERQAIECLVIDPASLQVNRRARRAKTDRLDVQTILRSLIAWQRGERHVCSIVHVSSRDDDGQATTPGMAVRAGIAAGTSLRGTASDSVTLQWRGPKERNRLLGQPLYVRVWLHPAVPSPWSARQVYLQLRTSEPECRLP